MQVILTEEEYKELKGQAKPLNQRDSMELATALAEICWLSPDFKEAVFHTHVDDRDYDGKHYKYQVIVKRVEENDK